MRIDRYSSPHANITALYAEWVWHDPISIERYDKKKGGIEPKENHRRGVFWDERSTKLRLPKELHVASAYDDQKSGHCHYHVHHHLYRDCGEIFSLITTHHKRYRVGGNHKSHTGVNL